MTGRLRSVPAGSAFSPVFLIEPTDAMTTSNSSSPRPPRNRVLAVGTALVLAMAIAGVVFTLQSPKVHADSLPVAAPATPVSVATVAQTEVATWDEFSGRLEAVDRVDLRFRASHFPFTEPSAEVDIRCSWDNGTLKLGEGDSWLEILGSGMVHPKVLQAGNIDPTQWQGFAFGMGIDRLAMLKYGIPDLRAFFESDLRWLRHYGFGALDVPTLAGGLSR